MNWIVDNFTELP